MAWNGRSCLFQTWPVAHWPRPWPCFGANCVTTEVTQSSVDVWFVISKPVRTWSAKDVAKPFPARRPLLSSTSAISGFPPGHYESMLQHVATTRVWPPAVAQHGYTVETLYRCWGFVTQNCSKISKSSFRMMGTLRWWYVARLVKKSTGLGKTARAPCATRFSKKKWQQGLSCARWGVKWVFDGFWMFLLKIW